MKMNPRLTLLALAIGLAMSAPAIARPYCAPVAGAYAGGGYGPPPCFHPCPPWNCAAPTMAPEGGWGPPHGRPACAPAKRGTPPPMASADCERRPSRHGAWDTRGGTQGRDPDKMAAIRLDRMAARLDLSDEQKTEVAAILEEARAEREAQRQATQAAIAALLTPEQLQTFESKKRPAMAPKPAQPQSQPAPDGQRPNQGQNQDQDAES